MEAAPVEVAAAPVTVIPATVPGVAAAIRPAPRPAALRAPDAAPVVAASAAPAEAAAPASPALTDALPAGTHLVQLGAFDSAEIAASEWERLQGPFGEFLGGKERVIQETQSNGRTFYRLRAKGFSDRAEARILCAALTAEDADCIPVTVD
jgi:cell division protein FtsN